MTQREINQITLHLVLESTGFYLKYGRNRKEPFNKGYNVGFDLLVFCFFRKEAYNEVG